MVLTHEAATAQRLFIYKEKLAPEVRGYLKSLPDAEQPISLAGMHRAVRKWAEIQREGQASGKRTKWGEHIDNITETRKKKDAERKKKLAEKKKKEEEAAKSKGGAGSGKGQQPELVAALAQVSQDLQAFMKKGSGPKVPQSVVGNETNHRQASRRIGQRRSAGSVGENT